MPFATKVRTPAPSHHPRVEARTRRLVAQGRAEVLRFGRWLAAHMDTLPPEIADAAAAAVDWAALGLDVREMPDAALFWLAPPTVAARPTIRAHLERLLREADELDCGRN